MDQNDVHIDGLTELLDKFTALDTKAAKGSLRKALKAGGKVFKDEVIARTPVKTGQLRDDIIAASTIDANQGTGTCSIGPTIHSFYGEFQELGTSKQPARPFMRPAFDAKADDAIDAFVTVLNEAIDEATK